MCDMKHDIVMWRHSRDVFMLILYYCVRLSHLYHHNIAIVAGFGMRILTCSPLLSWLRSGWHLCPVWYVPTLTPSMKSLWTFSGWMTTLTASLTALLTPSLTSTSKSGRNAVMVRMIISWRLSYFHKKSWLGLVWSDDGNILYNYSRPGCMPGSRYTGVGVPFFVIWSWNC